MYMCFVCKYLCAREKVIQYKKIVRVEVPTVYNIKVRTFSNGRPSMFIDAGVGKHSMTYSAPLDMSESGTKSQNAGEIQVSQQIINWKSSTSKKQYSKV